MTKRKRGSRKRDRSPRRGWLRTRWFTHKWLRRTWLRHTWRSAVGAVCGIALAAACWSGIPTGLRWVKSHPYFALATIEVDGNRRLSHNEVLQAAGVQTGTSVWDATPSPLQARLESHPWILHASVRREFPNRLTIGVRERRPVAIVRLDALNYVDRSGRVLGPLRDDDSRDFPLITGFEKAGTRGFAPIGVHRALQLLRRCERTNCFDAVSEVHVDRHRGVTVFPLHTAVVVVLGWGSWGDKLARSARVFAAWEGQTGRLAAVDVSFRDLVVLKLHAEHHPAAVRSLKRGMRV